MNGWREFIVVGCFGGRDQYREFLEQIDCLNPERQNNAGLETVGVWLVRYAGDERALFNHLKTKLPENASLLVVQNNDQLAKCGFVSRFDDLGVAKK